MADAPIVHIGENSPEHVAYQLLLHIAWIEQKAIQANGSFASPERATRKWILDTYDECLLAVKGQRMPS